MPIAEDVHRRLNPAVRQRAYPCLITLPPHSQLEVDLVSHRPLLLRLLPSAILATAHWSTRTSLGSSTHPGSSCETHDTSTVAIGLTLARQRDEFELESAPRILQGFGDRRQLKKRRLLQEQLR
ncbi:hypothetical protein G7K_5198-t1 [Saitoella complicata NRRL Y-17804]|uniref:Uncharacterized protein n=1 Tax=Saitoella complicata (strain BCRC 22490 / CBS 7301 / JCM 7358 / NBRC 10748 / NRRL Y-17804) TaxID=698492 RepID=A0A0E9NN27_SAICN|nr:hypothetical protein G7K_5198-t1 [Saitoella complicata NRRL Y-17804]